MKKLNYLILCLAGLAMASCSQDDLITNNPTGDGNFNVTVQLPADLATRAEPVDMNTGLTANDLYYAVYDASDGNLVLSGQTTFGNSLKTTVSFNLANAKNYNISFFASAPDNGVYTFDAKNKIMTVDYDAMSNEGTEQEDLYDCFINLLETGTIGQGTVNTSITLYRPIAQINWGTNDLDSVSVKAAFGPKGTGEYLQSTLTTTAYNTFSLLDNDVVTNPNSPLLPAGQSYQSEVELNLFTQPLNAKNEVATFPVSGYEYVTMQYLLAPVKESTVYDVDLAITNSGIQEENPAAEVITHVVEVNAAPVQGNYRTNIYGSLLTDNINIIVDKSPDWDTPDYNLPQDGAAFIAALKNGGYVLMQEDVELPNTVTISENTTLDMNGHTLKSPGTGTPADDGSLTVTNGATLTITGNGTMETQGTYASILLWAVDGSTINVENGTFIANAEGEIAYIGGRPNSTAGGTINIMGGTFKPTADGSGKYSCLNCYDKDYNAGTAKFNVTGGVFYGFNPAASTSEPNGTVNWVADGYTSTEMTIDGETAYVIAPTGYTPIINANQTAITAGGKIALAEDFDYENGRITFAKTTELDLNGFTLTSAGNANGDVLAGGANMTIKNGTVAPGPNTNEKFGALIYFIPSGATTLTLENVTAIGGNNPVYLNSSNSDSHIIIKSGTYASAYDNAPAVYVQKGGSVTIEDGLFGLPGVKNPYLLNIADGFRVPNTDRQPNEIIVVKGGTFINFNPANNGAEGTPTNFVADGYKVVSKVVGTDTYYEVVPE